MIADVDTQAVAAGLALVREAQAKINRNRCTDRAGAPWNAEDD